MSNLIEGKLESSVENSLVSKIKNHKLRTALDYLNQISFTIDGTSDKSIELLSNDTMCLVGNLRMTNLILTKLTVQCLLPRKYGGFKSPKVFILDAGNCTDVYQFIDFMKQHGLNVKKNLKKIMISRVFTVYQLTHFLKYELARTVHDYGINIVVIPDLLSMFVQEVDMKFNEVNFLLTDVISALRTITRESKVLLISSISLGDELCPSVRELGNKIVKCFNENVVIDKNKTNDRYKLVIQQKQDANFVAIKKYMSLKEEDVLRVKGRC